MQQWQWSTVEVFASKSDDCCQISDAHFHITFNHARNINEMWQQIVNVIRNVISFVATKWINKLKSYSSVVSFIFIGASLGLGWEREIEKQTKTLS